MGTIPDFSAGEADGKGALNKVSFRKGHGNGDERVYDLALVFPVETEEHAEVVDRYIPGAHAMFGAVKGMSDEEKGDDHKRERKPKNGEGAIVLSGTKTGKPLAEGSAEVRKMLFRCGVKTATLTLFVRVFGLKAAAATPLAEHLDEPVDIEWKSSQPSLGFPEKDETRKRIEDDASGDDEDDGDDGDDDADDLAVEIVDGGLVSFENEGATAFGRVVAIGDGGVEILAIGAPKENAILVDESAIRSCVKITGPGGPNPDSAIKRYVTRAREMGREPSARELITAIGVANGRGLVEKDADGAWPLTKEVIDLALGEEPTPVTA